MRVSFIWKLLLLAVVDPCFGQVDSLRIVCYFDDLTSYNQGNVKYTMDDINTTLCTHLVYNYVTLNFTTHYKESNWATNDKYRTFVGLKQKNPQLKLMFSLPSWNYDMRALSSNEALRNTVTRNIVKFLRQFQFDGLDMNIVYTNLEYWIISFADILGRILKKEKFLFSVAIGNYAVDSVSQDEISRFNRYLDFINIHTYEFRFPTSEQNQKADHHAPLYSRTWDTNQFMNIDSVVNKWLDKGLPSNKIVMAIPLFGISWTLSSNTITPPAPATGPGNLLTKARNRNGYIPYCEICQAVGYKSWWVHSKNEKMGPYAVSPYDDYNYRTWVGYDDPAMAIVKSEYILSKGLGGAAVADVNMDDLNNWCGGGSNPMMKAIYKTFTNSISNPGFTQTTTTVSGDTIIPKTDSPQSPNETSRQSTSSITEITSAVTKQQPSSPPSSSYETTKTFLHSLPTTTHSMTSDDKTDINLTCNPSGDDFIILSVIFVFLIITLLFVLTKIFCGRKPNLIK